MAYDARLVLLGSLHPSSATLCLILEICLKVSVLCIQFLDTSEGCFVVCGEVFEVLVP